MSEALIVQHTATSYADQEPGHSPVDLFMSVLLKDAKSFVGAAACPWMQSFSFSSAFVLLLFYIFIHISSVNLMQAETSAGSLRGHCRRRLETVAIDRENKARFFSFFPCLYGAAL